MSVMSSLVSDVLDRIATKASSLKGKKINLTSKEIQKAVKEIFPEHLAEGAVRMGSEAVGKYTSSKGRSAEPDQLGAFVSSISLIHRILRKGTMQ